MAKQVINVGTTSNDRTGDSIRSAFTKVNSNFTELYNAIFNEPSVRDIVGSIFADDSTLLVDAVAGKIVGPVFSNVTGNVTGNLTGNVTGNVTGNLVGDIRGSVFADDSSVMVNAVDRKLVSTTAELGTIEIAGNTITTTDSSAITIDQVVNLGSDVNVGGDLLPNVANGGNLGSSAKPWGSLYVSNNTIYIGGQAISINDQGELTFNNNRVAHENGEFMTLDNLSDLNVNSPNSGDTIAWAGYQWVNVPLTQDRLADDGDEVVLVGGANPYVTFPAITGGDQLIIQGAEVSSVSGSLALTSQDNLNIIANGSGAAPGGSKNWTFGADGSVTIPGDIRSEQEINININLADSTKRIWSFQEDGDLVFPGGKVSIQASTSSGSIRGSTNTPIIVSSIGSTGSSSLQWVNNAVTPTALSGVIVNGGGNAGDVLILTGTYNPSTGALDKSWTFGTDGSLTLPRGYIKNNTTDGFLRIEGPLFADMVSLGGGGYATISNGVEILTHGVGDDTERKFRFSWDGSLYMPTANNNSQVGAIEWRLDNGATAQVKSTPGGGFYNIPKGLQFLTYNGAATTISVEFDKNWIFRDDGSLTIPGDIKSDSNINIDINLADSTLRRWSFGEDGELTLPEDAVVKTISGNLTIEGESYVIIDSANNGQIEIGRSSGVGAVILGNKSLGTNSIIDSDLFVNNGVYERFSSLADATGIVTHNCANGHIFYHTSPDALFTVNFTNLNLPIDYATSLTLIIAQGGTGFIPNSVGISGVLQTINWQGNVTPTPSTNRTDVVTFRIICTALNTYTVLGQLTGF